MSWLENKDVVDLIIKVFLGLLTTCFAIEVTPIKINPISWFCRKISTNINKDRDKKLGDIEKKLDEHIKLNKRYEAISARTNIIRFAEDLKMKHIPSEEHFDIIIDDINFYEKFCAANKDFPNNKCLISIDFIKKMYKLHYFRSERDDDD